MKLNSNINILLNCIKQKKQYTKVLENKIELLKNLKDYDYRLVHNKFFSEEKRLFLKTKVLPDIKKNSAPLVSFIISVSFTRVNTFLHVMDFAGKMKFFYSAGTVQCIGKQKRARKSALKNLFNEFFKNSNFLHNLPVALHLTNVSFFQKYIIKYLRKKLFVTIVRIFTKISFNGCRKRKLKRKKIRTKSLKITRDSSFNKKNQASTPLKSKIARKKF